MTIYCLNVLIRGDTSFCQNCWIPDLPDDYQSYGRISATVNLDVGLYSSFEKAEERLRIGKGLLGHGDRFQIYVEKLDSLTPDNYYEKYDIWQLSEDKKEWNKLYSDEKRVANL